MKRFFPVLVTLSACATMGGMRTEPLDRGVAKVYEADLETAVRATRKALLGVPDFLIPRSAFKIDDVVELDGSTWMFLAKNKTAELDDEVFVRVIVQETAENENTIRVLSKSRWALNLWRRNHWSDVVFAALASDLTEKQRPS